VFRTLASRLTAYYVFAALGLMLAAALALTISVVSIMGRGAASSVDSVAAQIPELVSLYRSQHKTLRTMAPELVKHFASTPVRLAIVESPTLPAPPQFIRPGGNRGEVAGLFITGTNPAFGGAPTPQSAAAQSAADRDLRDFRAAHEVFPLSVLIKIHPARVAVAGGYVLVFPDFVPLNRRFQLYWMILLVSGTGVVMLVWLLGRYITQQALRPLHEVTRALERFSQGDFTPNPIMTGDRSELGLLARAYNGAVDQVTRAFAERDRYEEMMRQFIADAGHELRTPLTVVMGFIDILRRGKTNDPALTAKILDTMSQESRRMRRLIEKLIVLARLNQLEEEAACVIDVATLTRRIGETFAALDGNAERLHVDAAEPALAFAHEHEVHEAITNLIDNALKYAPSGPIDVQVHPNGASVEIAVRDHGPGFTPEDKAHAFDRFYRGEQRTEAEGSGLGLAIAKRAVERAAGHIEIESSPGEGTRITVRLPKAVDIAIR